MDLRVKSAREAASAGDGARLLVDRLWPRGVSKARLALTDWVKDVAPSAELRTCVPDAPANALTFALVHAATA